jgi:hypothetical protein
MQSGTLCCVVEFRENQTVSKAPGPETDFTVFVLRKQVEHVIRRRKIQDCTAIKVLGVIAP